MSKLSLLCLVLLAACTSEKVYTVAEFKADPALLKKISADCMNDPGRKMLLPNCINANQAQHLANFGDGNIPRIDTSLPDAFQHKK